MALMEVNDLCVNYGAIKAVRGVSFYLDQGEIVTILGANGAGKSTIMKTLAGVVKPASGAVTWKGAESSDRGMNLFGMPSHKIVKQGIILSPEGRQIFPRLTVKENLQLGAYSHHDKALAEEKLEYALTLFPILKKRIRQMGGTLSGGEQQMLAIARALQADPRLLMLDEPSLGLAPIIVQEIFELFRRINENGVTILLVEQNARMALNISDRGYVLENGKIAMTDTGAALSCNEKVQAAYLGK